MPRSPAAAFIQGVSSDFITAINEEFSNSGLTAGIPRPRYPQKTVFKPHRFPSVQLRHAEQCGQDQNGVGHRQKWQHAIGRALT
jgi:hypothetical protein